jgi:hypothetical protein
LRLMVLRRSNLSRIFVEETEDFLARHWIEVAL